MVLTNHSENVMNSLSTFDNCGDVTFVVGGGKVKTYKLLLFGVFPELQHDQC